jgi:two-component system OmpR family response regulator
MARAKVLVVEDNTDMREAVVGYLRSNGYVVSGVGSGEDVFSHDLQLKADIALLDISLPGISGLEITKRLKQTGFDGPIIALTARDTVDDKLVGLEAGMTDYLVKPFDLRELRARIDAQLRIHGQNHDLSSISTDHFRIEPRRHRFYHDGKEVKLTMVEFRIMHILMQNNQTTVNTQDIIDHAWGEEAGLTTPPIRIHISNLRSKIRDENLTVIQTIPGIGYFLND